MRTTTYSILRQSGVLFPKNIINVSVTMLITGKTSEENLISLTTITMKFVITGNQAHLLVITKKAVSLRLLVSNHMVGKNKSIILCITRQNLVKTISVRGQLSVHFIIVIKIIEMYRK
jgi:hypothetical protein